MKSDIVSIGEILIDFASVSADELGYPTMAAHPGGAPANFLAAAQKCGLQTAMLGKVGEDAFGHLLIGTLKDAGIETRGVVIDPKVFTTLAFVTFDESGDRSFSFARKPGADTCLRADELDLTLIEECRDLHFGTLSLTDEPARSACEKAIAYAKQQGKLISFDPNYRAPLWTSVETAKDAILWGLGQADIVKISDNEVDLIFGLSPEEGAKAILEKHPVKLVFVTCGADGCVYANRNAFGSVPGLKGIKAIDTTGAGDIFGGSAVAAVLKSGKAPDALGKEELKEIASFAVKMSGLSVTKPGGISGVPELSEVEALG